MSPRCNGRFKVLVVDDDPSVLSTYRRLLDRCGYRTVAEDDPRKALADGHAEKGVDLLLLDYKMPGLDGLSLLAELRKKECRARCILISAYLNDDIRSQAKNLGVDRVLDKPVDACALRRAISDLLPMRADPPVKAAG